MNETDTTPAPSRRAQREDWDTPVFEEVIAEHGDPDAEPPQG